MYAIRSYYDWIYPDYDNCLYANGYEYVIQAGDVVEVSAAGSTVSRITSYNVCYTKLLR